MNKKVILHIPHSSTKIPYLDGFIKDKQKISQEISRLTDWYTDDLFSNKIDDAIITPFSRLFCDVERFADDDLEAMSKFGMGVIYDKFDDGSILRVVTPELRKRILQGFYWKHHNKLSELVKIHLKTNSSCLIVDCHSFPENTLNRALNKTAFRPDFNIGTDAFHTPKKLVEVATKYFENLGYSLGIDEPYSGTIVPVDYYKKDIRVQSIMLEVNRKLYLSGKEKTDSYNKTKEVVQGFLTAIKEV
ncbi:N-formylglutamate amidohydrolase [Winogradskyella sp.]|nr:N-formylglutamate amidohydrolase [Winogradskyella sp.]